MLRPGDGCEKYVLEFVEQIHNFDIMSSLTGRVVDANSEGKTLNGIVTLTQSCSMVNVRGECMVLCECVVGVVVLSDSECQMWVITGQSFRTDVPTLTLTLSDPNPYPIALLTILTQILTPPPFPRHHGPYTAAYFGTS